MKKIVIILGIVLTSGIAALALSFNKDSEMKTAQVKMDRSELKTSGQSYSGVKNNITNAD